MARPGLVNVRGRGSGIRASTVRAADRKGPEPAEDLMRVGYARLMKAAGDFGPAVGTNPATRPSPEDRGRVPAEDGRR
jgi:hypothetical protein